ncbi:inositol monophosphatase family protein [Leucothrix arctica]|uniref:Inositol monophosphatase n=1 Tax=Leucothrix arctica TaxID=1481894 RepID=A0A317CMV6_9GAMM|nr:inositol monophosphatase family protein [Leucothrix arctica]PWQ98793.1 inositol monophosphatase [Leucothrix arctica]
MLPDIKILETIIHETAQQEILPRFNKIGYELKADGSLITEADLSADRKIQSLLKQHYPHIAFMSEEMTESEQTQLLQTEPEIWCLDPLDGTSNFAAGFPLFSSSLALIKDGAVVIAVTYDVNRDEMFTAVKGQGAYLNGVRLLGGCPTDDIKSSVAIVDFKRLPKHLTLKIVEEIPYRSQRNLGSSVLEWAWMAAGRGQLYLHGQLKLWDCAAGTLLLSEAGGYSSTLEGEPVFNIEKTVCSVVASPSKDLYKKWFAYLSS